MAAKKLVILTPCVGPGGKILERGDVIAADERDTYTLIAASRAVDADTKEGKELVAEIAAEHEAAPKAKK